MNEIPVASVERKRKIGSHWIIFAILLLIPLSVAVVGYFPRYYSFTAQGEIVPIREIGVDGSVHFVYVLEGVTNNLYEKFSVRQAYPDASFTRVDSSYDDDIDELREIEAEMRNETIRHAVDSAAKASDESLSDGERDARLARLFEETANYYGDSIGLMLGIGLYEEREHEDFSHGGLYTIAGTGTLEEDDSVGSVGAIPDKLRTAEAQGADIFFVPKDKETFFFYGLSNEEEARQVADEEHLRVRVVPVSTLEEALAFLKQLNS